MIRLRSRRRRITRSILTLPTTETLEQRALPSRLVIVAGTPLAHFMAESESGTDSRSTNAHGGVTDALRARQTLFERVGYGPEEEVGDVRAGGYMYLSDNYFGITNLSNAIDTSAFDGRDVVPDPMATEPGHVIVYHPVKASSHAEQLITLQVVPDAPEEMGLPVTVSLRGFLSFHSSIPWPPGPIAFSSRAAYVLPGQSPVTLKSLSVTQVPELEPDPYQVEAQGLMKTIDESTTFTLHVGESFVVDLDLTQTLDASLAPTILDPITGDAVSRGDYFELASSVQILAKLLPGIVLTADHDDLATDEFGPYLVDAPLTTTFTATLTGSARDAAKVALMVPGHGAFVATPVNGVATFSVPLGTGPASLLGEQTMTVRALRADDTEIVKKDATIVFAKADLELQARYPVENGKSEWFDIEGLRFLDIPSLTLDFKGTIAPIASYYLDKIETIQFGDNTLVDIALKPDGSFEFSDYDVNPLDPADDKVQVVYQPTGKRIGDSEPLTIIALPDWMGTPLSQGYNPAVPMEVFGAVAGAYVLELTFPPALQFNDLPDLEPESLGVFGFLLSKPLANDVGLGLHLTVYAKPTINVDDTRLKVKDAFARVTLLDQVLLNETKPIPDKDVKVEATLDPKTLESVKTIKVTTADVDLKALIPHSKAFDLPFGGGSANSWAVPIPGLGPFEVAASVSFSGRFQGELVSLVGQLGIELDVSGRVPKLVKDGTFITLAGAAFAELSAKAQGSFGLTIIPVDFTLPVGTLAIEGALGANLAAIARVNFSGPIDRPPTVSFDNKNSLGQLNLYYAFNYNYAWFSDEVDPNTSWKSASGVLPIVIFGASATGAPGLDNPASLNLTGPGDPASPGYPGAQPTEGTTAVELGATGSGDQQGPSPQQFQALAAPAAPVSTLEVLSPLDDRATSLAFDLNVLAGAPTLTPGAHWLETLLVGPDGREEVPLGRVDLSSLALTANDNPLGFSSGWIRPALTVPSDAMAPARPYKLVFRLQTDHDATGEPVAVLLDGLSLGMKTPRVVPSGPLGGVEDGRLNFGADPADPGLGIIRLKNEGDQWLVVGPAALTGSGYALDALLASGFELAPGDQIDLRVRQVNSTATNPGRLVLTTDDPTRPSIELVLVPTLTENPLPNQAPVVQPIAQQAVLEGTTLVVLVSASDVDSGQTLTYGIDPGAPEGAHVDPNTGAFTWTATAPGQYAVTVRVTDDGSPAQSASRTCTITVGNVAPVVNAGAGASMTQGEELTRSGSFVDPGVAGAWTATVDYGDGSGQEPLTLNADKSFALNHVYAAAGTRAVTVLVMDAFGGQGAATFDVTVEPKKTDVTGPRVVSLSRSGLFWAPTVLTVAFDEPLDRSRASDASNYQIRGAGRDRRFGTDDDMVIPITSARLSPNGRIVRLAPSKRLPFFSTRQLTISGAAPKGVTDLAGNLLDGNRDGLAGGDFARSFRGYGPGRIAPLRVSPMPRPPFRPLPPAFHRPFRPFPTRW